MPPVSVTEIIVILLSCLVMIIPFWKICTKAGFPGALSVLIFIPVVNLIFLFYLAFAQWPALK